MVFMEKKNPHPNILPKKLKGMFTETQRWHSGRTQQCRTRDPVVKTFCLCFGPNKAYSMQNITWGHLVGQESPLKEFMH